MCLLPLGIKWGGNSIGGTSLSAANAAFESGLVTETFGFFTSSKKALTDASFRQKEMKFCTRLSREVDSALFAAG